MANSRKSTSDDLLQRVTGALLPAVPAGGSILLGLSGGVDSAVLLHLLAELSPRHSWRLSALHVHHGISPHADEWAAFCRKLCGQYGIPFQLEYVDIAPLRERGVEAAARELRHAALARQSVDFIALAHHRDDQAETLLLQLLRGAGVKGAAAMAAVQARVGMPTVLRPLLDVSRSELLDFAARNQLRWVNDDSNSDDRYPRNYLRHRVLPLVEKKYPAYRETLARSARHFAEAAELLDQLAQQDMQEAVHGEALEVACLQSMDPVRGKNLLRYFLAWRGAPLPPAPRLEELLQQLCVAREDAAVCVTFGGWQVRRYQGRVYAMPVLQEFERNVVLPWQGEDELSWPALNVWIRFEHVHGAGISLARLHDAPVTLRLRSGGETLRPGLGASRRSLKNLLQERQVPPWQRERLPLLYCGDELVCVPGVAIAAEYRADAGQEDGVRLLLQ